RRRAVARCCGRGAPSSSSRPPPPACARCSPASRRVEAVPAHWAAPTTPVPECLRTRAIAGPSALDMDGSLIGTLGLGFVLGLKHALDADHLVAVSTIVGRERSIWKSAWVGVIWGMGHTAWLLLAAVMVIVLRISISPTVALSLEFCAGLMLMILGADLLRRVVRGDIA